MTNIGRKAANVKSVGRTVYLSGNDGVGKTTQARLLAREMRRRNIPSRYVWLRFPHLISAPLLLWFRAAGITRYEWRNGRRQGRWELFRAPRLARLLAWCQVADAALFRAAFVTLHTRRGTCVVLDRFVFDILVDIAVAARDPSLLDALPGRLLRSLAPPGVRIVLHGAPETIRRRRSDLDADPLLEARSDLFLKLAKRERLRPINCDRSIDEVHADIMRTVDAKR